MPEKVSQSGARRARTDARLAEAVTGLLDEQGYSGLTIEGVSTQSGVAKTTIYRRWATKAEMVFALAIHRPETLPPIDAGSLTGDVAVLAERAVKLIAEQPGRDVLPGLLSDMAGDPQLTDRLRQSFIAAARDDITTMLDRARERGDLAIHADAADIHAALLGIPYAHVHLLANTDIRALTSSLTEQLLRLLGAPPAD